MHYFARCNQAAQKYFFGNAQILKQMEMIENSLRENSKIVITDKGINPTLFMGSLPVTMSVASNGNGKEGKSNNS